MSESHDAPRGQATAPPIVIRVSSDEITTAPQVTTLVDDLRRQADAFVFLSGGASKMSPEAQRRLLELLGALATLADAGMRLAVGDGGTKAGIMEAAGLARRASRHPFPLVGVAPAPEITTSGEEGRTPADPNHTHLVAVDNPDWAIAKRAQGWTPDEGYWGSETAAMYALFDRLASGRPSVTIVANGGAITLDEVHENVAVNRPMVVVAGSGRAAAALVSGLRGTSPPDEDSRALRQQVDALGLTKRAELFHVFDLAAGPGELARLLARLLEPR